MHESDDEIIEDEQDYLRVLTGGGSVDPDLLRAAAATGDENPDAPGSDGPIAVTFQLTRDLNKRLDKYLQDRVPFMSRSQLQRLIHEEGVRVNGRTAKPSTTLRINDRVEVLLPPPPTEAIPPEQIPLSIVEENEQFIVVNKQADLIVHPARGNKTGTLINALAWHFAKNSEGRLSPVGAEQARPGVIHRLDRHTTGVMVVAKTETAHYRLARQFEKRTVDKRYLALVHGVVEPVADVIELPIGKHPRFRELMAVRYDDSAREATTVYRVRRQYQKYALMELELRTGRTHQIRVHLSHLGWPIVGDDMYGGAFVSQAEIVGGGEDRRVIDRQALHATSLCFHDPVSRRRREFTAPLWRDMHDMITLLEEHGRPGPALGPAGSGVDVEGLMEMGVAALT